MYTGFLPYQVLAIPLFSGIADRCRWEYNQLIFCTSLQICVLKCLQCDLHLTDFTLKKGQLVVHLKRKINSSAPKASIGECASQPVQFHFSLQMFKFSQY